MYLKMSYCYRPFGVMFLRSTHKKKRERAVLKIRRYFAVDMDYFQEISKFRDLSQNCVQNTSSFEYLVQKKLLLKTIDSFVPNSNFSKPPCMQEFTS